MSEHGWETLKARFRHGHDDSMIVTLAPLDTKDIDIKYVKFTDSISSIFTSLSVNIFVRVWRLFATILYRLICSLLNSFYLYSFNDMEEKLII